MPAVNTWIRTVWAGYRASTGLKRELTTLGIAVLMALLLLPVLVWMAGQFFLGDYIRDPSGARTGGFFAMWFDYLLGLATGKLGYWLVLLGPYAIYVSFKASRWLLKL
jgi:hypothetical protein